VQHFAAGVVFAAAAIELLPKVLKEDPWVAIGGFAVGIAVMFGMRAVTERLGATAVDFAIDGVILGAGFAAATTTGLLLTIALTIEYLFVGLSLSAALGPQASRRLVIAAPIGLSLLTVAGAALGYGCCPGPPRRPLPRCSPSARSRSCTSRPRNCWWRPTSAGRRSPARSRSSSDSCSTWC
jgi:ZIP family zinc transporter